MTRRFVGFGTGSGGGAPTGAAGGDLGSTYPNPTVVSVANVATGVLTPTHGSTVLDMQYATATLTGDSTDQTVLTFTIPGGTMRAGRGVRASMRFTNAGATATTYKWIFGGTTVIAFTNSSAANIFQIFEIINQPTVTNAQAAIFSGQVSANALAPTTIAESAIDTTAPVILKFTFNVANTVTLTKYYWILELLN